MERCTINCGCCEIGVTSMRLRATGKRRKFRITPANCQLASERIPIRIERPTETFDERSFLHLFLLFIVERDFMLTFVEPNFGRLPQVGSLCSRVAPVCVCCRRPSTALWLAHTITTMTPRARHHEPQDVVLGLSWRRGPKS